MLYILYILLIDVLTVASASVHFTLSPWLSYYGRPSEPYYDRPSEPYYGRPSEPYYDRPSEPYYDRPSEPYYGRPYLTPAFVLCSQAQVCQLLTVSYVKTVSLDCTKQPIHMEKLLNSSLFLHLSFAYLGYNALKVSGHVGPYSTPYNLGRRIT